MSTTIKDIREHFFKVCNWVDPANTWDQIMHGRPEQVVHKIGTGWMACAQNLEAAAADGCDLFIAHEGTFGGLWAPTLSCADTPWAQRRMRILQENSMACINLHDTWDNFPEHGIRDSWRKFLGLGELLEQRPCFYSGENRFTARNSLTLNRIRRQTLGEFAASLARACRVFPAFQGATVYGNSEGIIETAAVGVGCHIPAMEMVTLGAGVLVLTFDRAFQTTIRVPLGEMNVNMIVVEHGVTEMPGMQSMADYLPKAFPGIEAKFYCHEPSAQTVV